MMIGYQKRADPEQEMLEGNNFTCRVVHVTSVLINKLMHIHE